MGRKRKSRIDHNLPIGVYRRSKYIEYRFINDEGNNKSIYLRDDDGNHLRNGATISQINNAWRLVYTSNQNKGKTLSWLIHEYFKSNIYHSLSSKTQKGYQTFAKTIINKKTNKGNFGDLLIKKIKPSTIAAYRDSRADAKISANREIQFLSSVFSWAVERDYMQSNPKLGVRLNPQKSRTRYVEDWEYDLVYKLAPPQYKLLMELSYLCRARRGELTKMSHDSILKQGLFLKRSKGSDNEITAWSPRLSDVIEQCKNHNAYVESKYLIHDKKGDYYRDAALQTAWTRLKNKALNNGLSEPFTFHDIKAKGVTDHKNHEAGHKSARMRKVYVRRPDIVESTK